MSGVQRREAYQPPGHTSVFPALLTVLWAPAMVVAFLLSWPEYLFVPVAMVAVPLGLFYLVPQAQRLQAQRFFVHWNARVESSLLLHVCVVAGCGLAGLALGAANSTPLAGLLVALVMSSLHLAAGAVVRALARIFD